MKGIFIFSFATVICILSQMETALICWYFLCQIATSSQYNL